MFQFLLFFALFNTTPYFIQTHQESLTFFTYNTWLEKMQHIHEALKLRSRVKVLAIFWGCFQGNHLNSYWSTFWNNETMEKFIWHYKVLQNKFPKVTSFFSSSNLTQGNSFFHVGWNFRIRLSSYFSLSHCYDVPLCWSQVFFYYRFSTGQAD